MKNTVKKGYNTIAHLYLQKRDLFQNSIYLDKFMTYLEKGATILDIGCGAGVPIDSYLIDHGYKIRGIDISEKQIELAKKHVPNGEYEVKDMADLKTNEYNVDAIVSFYSIFHIDRKLHAGLFKKMATFLPKNGKILITLGYTDWEGTEKFHGQDMMWSHYDAQKNKALIIQAGFRILFDVIDTSGGEKHLIIIAEKE